MRSLSLAAIGIIGGRSAAPKNDRGVRPCQTARLSPLWCYHHATAHIQMLSTRGPGLLAPRLIAVSSQGSQKVRYPHARQIALSYTVFDPRW